MTLRNAFEGLATEGTLKRLLNMLNFSRDANDRMIVRIAANDTLGTEQLTQTVNTRFASNNTVGPWWSTGSPQAHDSREMLRASQRPNAVQPRRDRWTF